MTNLFLERDNPRKKVCAPVDFHKLALQSRQTRWFALTPRIFDSSSKMQSKEPTFQQPGGSLVPTMLSDSTKEDRAAFMASVFSCAGDTVANPLVLASLL